MEPNPKKFRSCILIYRQYLVKMATVEKVCWQWFTLPSIRKLSAEINKYMMGLVGTSWLMTVYPPSCQSDSNSAISMLIQRTCIVYASCDIVTNLSLFKPFADLKLMTPRSPPLKCSRWKEYSAKKKRKKIARTTCIFIEWALNTHEFREEKKCFINEVWMREAQLW